MRHKTSSISTSRCSTIHMHPSLFLHVKPGENIIAVGCFAVCELFAVAVRAARSGAPGQRDPCCQINLTYIPSKMLHQMKHLRANYRGFNTTLPLTNL